MTFQRTGALMFVGVAVAAVISAPVAGARPTCQDAGSHVRCETNGSVSIKAVPQTRAPHVGQVMPQNQNRRGVVLSW